MGNREQLQIVDEHLMLADLTLPLSLRQARLIRRLSFVAGRHCAARALAALVSAGVHDEPYRLMGRLADGRPDWPSGVVGSITHTLDRVSESQLDSHCEAEQYQGIAIAIVAHADTYLAVAVDIEPCMSHVQADEVKRVISLPAELQLGLRLGVDPALWMTILFSAKETLYKLLYPAVGVFMPFSAAEVIHAETFACNDEGCLSDNALTLRLTTVWGHYPIGHEVQVRVRQIAATEGDFVVSYAYLPQIISSSLF